MGGSFHPNLQQLGGASSAAAAQELDLELHGDALARHGDPTTRRHWDPPFFLGRIGHSMGIILLHGGIIWYYTRWP